MLSGKSSHPHGPAMTCGECRADLCPALQVVDSGYRHFLQAIHQSLSRLILSGCSQYGCGYVASWDLMTGERLPHC